jgi:hypothetical protein
MTNSSGTKETNFATSSNIYNEIFRFNFDQESKRFLFSYFTLNKKVKSNAECALAYCKNDEEKLDYLNKICMFSHS